MTERPLFIDPISTGDGDDVDDNPAPRWFLVAAVLILTMAAYYLGSFLNGPRESSPHRFEHGREVGGAGHGEPAATTTPTAAPTPTATGTATAAPAGTQTATASP